MKENRYKIYKVGSMYFFWNGKLILGLCKKIFQGGYDVTFGLINKKSIKFKIDYESNLNDSKTLSKTLNTIKHIYRDVLDKNGTICISVYSFNRERHLYEKGCLASSILYNGDFVIMDERVHKFPFTTIAYNATEESMVKEGLSSQEWFNGSEENRKKFETLGDDSTLKK